MKSLQVLGVVGFAASMAGCVPDWARENETGLIMEIAEHHGRSRAARPAGPGAILFSDVEPGIFNDDAVVTVNVYRKNPHRGGDERRWSTSGSRATRSGTSAPTATTSKASTCPTGSPGR